MFGFTLGVNKLPQIYCLRATNMHSSTIINLGSISPEKNHKIHRQVFFFFSPPGHLFLNDSLSIFMPSTIVHCAFSPCFQRTPFCLCLFHPIIFLSPDTFCVQLCKGCFYFIALSRLSSFRTHLFKSSKFPPCQ